MGLLWRVASGMTDGRLAVIALAALAVALVLLGSLLGFAVAWLVAQAVALMASLVVLGAAVYVLLFRDSEVR